MRSIWITTFPIGFDTYYNQGSMYHPDYINWEWILEQGDDEE